MSLSSDEPIPSHEPARVAPRQHSRAWGSLLLLTPIVALVIALVAVFSKGSPEPKVAVVVPAGYRAISDAYFGYAVPRNWALNGAYSDSAGDFFYGTDRAWAAESLAVRSSAPSLGEAPPHAALAFGVPRPTPYAQSAGTPTTVPGAAVSYRYQLTRPGGFQAVAIDTWIPSSQTEMWLIVAAPPDVTAKVLASLNSIGA